MKLRRDRAESYNNVLYVGMEWIKEINVRFKSSDKIIRKDSRALEFHHFLKHFIDATRERNFMGYLNRQNSQVAENFVIECFTMRISVRT